MNYAIDGVDKLVERLREMSRIEKMELSADVAHDFGCQAVVEFTVEHDEHGPYASVDCVRYHWTDKTSVRKYRPSFREIDWQHYTSLANEYIRENRL